MSGSNLWPGQGGTGTGSPTTGGSAVGTGNYVTPGEISIPGFGKEKRSGRAQGEKITGYLDAKFYSATELKNLFTKLQYNNGKKKPDRRLLEWMKSVGISDIRLAKEVWFDAATYAGNLAKSGENVSFFDVINSTAFQSTGLSIPKSLIKGAGSGSGGSNVSVQKYITITDPINARNDLRKTMMSTFNRLPTEQEYQDYVTQLNANEKKYFRQTQYLPDGTQRVTGVEFDRSGFLTKFVLSKVDFGDNLGGAAGQTQDTVNQMINDNGLKGYISDNKARWWMAKLLSGDMTAEQLSASIRDQAGVVYTAFKPLLDENPTMSLVDVASPYLKVYSDMLEIPSTQLDLKDALAKAAVTTDKGAPGLMNVFDYEKALRKDQRFQYTRKAANEASNLAASFARSFGVSL